MFLGIIPSRYNSSRFPGKPLVMLEGISMIERVYRQAQKTKSLNKIIVATDDDRIYAHVKNFGGEVVMTSATHQSGTDRCAEVISGFDENSDVVVNIQGDEPFIQPEQVDLLCSCFENKQTCIATLVKKITDQKEINDPNIVKVVISKNMNALYFSRHPLPYNRNKINSLIYYKHIGIYAYKARTLKEIASLPVSHLEQAELLEQLRWLENGYTIKTIVTHLETISIDTPEDLEKLRLKL